MRFDESFEMRSQDLRKNSKYFAIYKYGYLDYEGNLEVRDKLVSLGIRDETEEFYTTELICNTKILVLKID